jgi:hypothetical protein
MLGADSPLIDRLIRDLFPAAAALRAASSVGEGPISVRLAAFAEENVSLVLFDDRYSSTRQAARYLRGGVISITPRLLLTDLLTCKLPAHHVTGILIL